MYMLRPRLAALFAGAGAALVLGVPAFAAGPSGEKLEDFRIVGASSAKAGVVSFKVGNSATIRHELVVIRTDAKAGKLRIKNGRAVEKGSLGEVELNGGGAKTLTLTLKPGHYVLICNVGSHYLKGMRKDFTVT
jgi:uncharacterized cupredoxin-like copper-binding protein